MWLSQLALVNFRNFRRLRLEPQPGVLVFCGQNGQGKTNLLESVYVLATTRSPRTSVERELLSWRTPEDPALAELVAPFAKLEARVRRLEAEIHLEITFESERTSSGLRDSPSVGASPGTGATPGTGASPGTGTGTGASPGTGPVSRTIKVNGLATRATGLVGQLPVVFFSPADVELAGGSPSRRRQYLNLANSQVSPGHLRALQRYNRVLLQRNQVLRLVREHRQPPSALEPWTEQMLDWGAQILHQRLAMLSDIDDRVAAIQCDLAGTTETLRVAYHSTVCELPTPACPPVDDLRDAFRQRQAQLAVKEVEQAVSLVGPHRDDFTFVLDDVDLSTYGSRGQQRLAVLALKLAEADWMRTEIGELPLVLLDDVLSELDHQRRAYVLQRVAESEPTHQRQVWITTTDADPAPLNDVLKGAQRYVIEAGQIRMG